MDNNDVISKEDKLFKKCIYNKGIINNRWIIIGIAILIILCGASGLQEDFITLIKVICSIFALLISVIVYSKIPNINNEFVKHVGIGFLYLGLVDCIEIFLQNINSTDFIYYSLGFTSSAMEALIILFAVLLHKKRFGFIIGNIIFSSSAIIIFIIAEFVIKVDNYRCLSKIDTGMLIIIGVTSMFITIYLLKNYEYEMISGEKKCLVAITIIFVSCNIINTLNYLLEVDLSYIQQGLKLIAYVIAYKYVEAKLLNNGYRDTLDKLTSIQETGKILNNNLINKERRLKESQMNIRKGEEQYQSIIESIVDGIFIFEREKLIYSNKYGAEYLFSELESIEENVNLEKVLKILTNENFDKEIIRNGFVDEFVFKKGDNVHTNITITLKNIMDLKTVLIVRDSTGLAELQKLREERKKVKETEVIKDEFYSNISHELRTPINVVNSALQLNNLMLENNDLNGMIKNNNIIRQNCLRLIRTVNNFIDTNRISEGFLEANKKVYNIVDVVESVVLACNKYMVLKDNQLIFDTELEEIYISIDKEHIERIMLNILSNSLKYGKVGGKIDVTIKSNKYGVKIVVRNDAPPVGEEQRKIIFDKFTKLDSSLTRPSEGSGLGLYLTKELVELNGGVIGMTSIEGTGNVFEINIPFIFSGEPWEVNVEDNQQNLNEKVNIEFSDIYFN